VLVNRAGRGSKVKLGIATLARENAPSYHLRFRSVLEFLKNKGMISYREMVRTIFGKYKRISFDASTDIIFIARIFDADYLKKIYGYAADNRTPVLFETDDLLLFDRRSDKPAENFEILSTYLAKATGIVTSTQYLADELKKYNSRVFLFPNLLDPAIWNTDNEKKRNNTQKLNICCIGTGIMPENLRLIVPAIEYCNKAYGRDIVFHLWGNQKYIARNIRELNNVKLTEGKVPYTKFAVQLQESSFDMAVVPLNDSHFNRAKSNIKYLEYAISGIPAIFSKVEPYKNLPDGKSCILAENSPEDWRSKIVETIENEEVRSRLSSQAFDDVLRNYMLNETWADMYLSVLKRIHEN
jgi:glycosyltransferase involved in cell wall biosynthesis